MVADIDCVEGRGGEEARVPHHLRVWGAGVRLHGVSKHCKLKCIKLNLIILRQGGGAYLAMSLKNL